MLGVSVVRSFYRLFLGPGMEHCGGGPGPNAIGGVFGLPPSDHDPSHDVVAALAHWVEDGVAPETIVATRYRDNDPAKGIEAQRPWCPWPAAARYGGHGDRADAANYACVTGHSKGLTSQGIVNRRLTGSGAESSRGDEP